MHEEKIKNYLKKHLKLNVSVEGQRYGCSGDITITLSLGEEEITSCSFDGSEIESTIADGHYE